MIFDRVFWLVVGLIAVACVSSYMAGSCNGRSRAQNACKAEALALSVANAAEAARVAALHEASRQKAAQKAVEIDKSATVRQKQAAAVVSAVALTLTAPLSKETREAILEAQRICLED